MVLVGYEEDYWILKNWWGQRWGERGYMKARQLIFLKNFQLKLFFR